MLMSLHWVGANEELFTTLPAYKYRNLNSNKEESGAYIFLKRPGGLCSKYFKLYGMQGMWAVGS
jgi:hypothetical protein